MKNLIDKFILQFAYKKPTLWLGINKWFFDQIQNYKEIIETSYKKDIEYAFWMSELSAIDTNLAKKYLASMDENVKFWMQEGRLEFSEYLPSELYYAAAEVYENVGESNLATQHYSLCAQEYENLQKLSKFSKPR